MKKNDSITLSELTNLVNAQVDKRNPRLIKESLARLRRGAYRPLNESEFMRLQESGNGGQNDEKELYGLIMDYLVNKHEVLSRIFNNPEKKAIAEIMTRNFLEIYRDKGMIQTELQKLRQGQPMDESWIAEKMNEYTRLLTESAKVLRGIRH